MPKRKRRLRKPVNRKKIKTEKIDPKILEDFYTGFEASIYDDIKEVDRRRAEAFARAHDIIVTGTP